MPKAPRKQTPPASPTTIGLSSNVGPRYPDASQRVAAEIQRFILDNELGADARLGTEEELAEQFEVSRPTLREGLRLLASGTLVRSSKGPGGGIFVVRTIREGIGRTMSMSIAAMLEANAITVDELLDARLTLEVRIAGLAARRATPSDIAEITAATDAARQSVELGEDLLDSDARFHRAIAASSGNRLHLTFTDWVFEVFQPKLIEIVRSTVDNAEIVAQHQAIRDAIADGKPTRAERAMQDHLEYLGKMAEQARARPGKRRRS